MTAYFVLYVVAIGSVWIYSYRSYRSRLAKMRRLSDRELVLSCPSGVSAEEWIAARRGIARLVGAASELLDPSMTIARATTIHEVFGISALDFDVVLHEEFVFRHRPIPAMVETIGDLMLAIIEANRPVASSG